MNRPLALSHKKTTIRTRTNATTQMTSGINHGAELEEVQCGDLFQCFEGRLKLKLCPQLPAKNAANPITHHFAGSKGRNRTFFIHSKAAPNGSKISILGCSPFISTFQALNHKSYMVALLQKYLFGDSGR